MSAFDSLDPFAGFELLSTYLRADALADKVLVDISDEARQLGFRVPVATTAAVYAYLDPLESLIREGQSLAGRTHDLLSVLRFAGAVHPDRSMLHFRVLFVLTPGCPPEPVALKAIIGPGDSGEPVLTILLPSED